MKKSGYVDICGEHSAQKDQQEKNDLRQNIGKCSRNRNKPNKDKEEKARGKP